MFVKYDQAVTSTMIHLETIGVLKVEALSQPRTAGKVPSRLAQPDRALSSKQYIRRWSSSGGRMG